MRWKHLIVSLLVTLMVLQAGRLVHELARKPAARFTPMATGAQPRSLGMVDAMGNGQRELRLDGARLTVLVAFRSTCRYCDRALPAWKALARIVGQRHPDIAVFAVSDEPAPVATAWLRDRGLTELPFRRIRLESNESAERSITGRTPWYFIFDSSGTLRRQGYGGDVVNGIRQERCRLSALTSVVQSSAVDTASSPREALCASHAL